MFRLVKDYDIAFVSTGDVLRKEIMAKSEVGKRAEEVVASGGQCLVDHCQTATDDQVWFLMSLCLMSSRPSWTG